MRQTRGQSIVGEFESISLGDKRLERRLTAIAQAMEGAPGESFVEQAGNVAALEATYRFFSNKWVIPEAIFEGHAVKTAERAAAHERVLIVHDTTEFRFGGAKERKGLGCVSNDKRDGFLAHYSLCLAPDGDPAGLPGALRLEPPRREEKVKGVWFASRSKPGVVALDTVSRTLVAAPVRRMHTDTRHGPRRRSV